MAATQNRVPLLSIDSVDGVLLYIEKSPVTAHKKTPSQHVNYAWPSLVALVVKKNFFLDKKKNLPANAGDVRDTDLIPGLGRSPGGGHGNPLQYSCLEISWTEEPDKQVMVLGVAQSQTLSNSACTLAVNSLKKKVRKQINLDSAQNK